MPQNVTARAPRAQWQLRTLVNGIGRCFPRSVSIERVVTSVRFGVSPDDAWRSILFFEEVPGPAPAVLRWLLPCPVRTSGEKTREGSIVRCTYDGGYLIKRIDQVNAPHLVTFSVIEQRIGIEGCVSTEQGSYEIAADGAGVCVVLSTKYRGHLRPRWLWRPVERYLAYRMHRHILDGMRTVISQGTPDRASA